jgi:hypothetical protein
MEVTGQPHAHPLYPRYPFDSRPHSRRNTTQNSALTGSQCSSCGNVLTDKSRLPEKWLWLISVFFIRMYQTEIFHTGSTVHWDGPQSNCPLGRPTVQLSTGTDHSPTVHWDGPQSNCPLGQTVQTPLAGRNSPPDALAPRTAIFSLTCPRQYEHTVQFRPSNVTNLQSLYKQFLPHAKSVTAIFSTNL